MNIQAVQKAVRGHANMWAVNPGETISGLEAQIVGAGLYFDSLPVCPAGGSYTLGGDRVPDEGAAYMSCSLSLSEMHEPEDLTNW